MPVNIIVILAIGLAIGFISGMFGVGGGFLTTPLLIFIGIPPAVAAATVTCHIAGTTFSAALAYWRRRALDPALAILLLCGGLVGAACGVLDVQPAARDRTARYHHRDRLRRPARRGRHADDRGERACHQPRAPWPADRAAPSRQPRLVSRPAAEIPLQALEDLRLDHPGGGDRLPGRVRLDLHRHRRRLPGRAGADLHHAGADLGRDRHLADPHARHHGGRHRSCTPRPTTRSMRCWR